MAAPTATTPGTAPADSRPARGADLRDLPILRDAAPDAAARAATRARWRTYPAGALIVDIDNVSSEVFFILEGTVRVQIRTPAGRELILAEIAAGGMVGEIAAIDREPRTATVTAVVPSRLCAVPADAFIEAACSSPAASLALLRHTTGILRRQAQRVVEREALPVRLRLCAELLRLSRLRTQGTRPGERIISPPPPQHEIAARIGARREAVSRELAELVRQGSIEKSRAGLVLPDPDALAGAIIRGEAEAGVSPAR